MSDLFSSVCMNFLSVLKKSYQRSFKGKIRIVSQENSAELGRLFFWGSHLYDLKFKHLENEKALDEILYQERGRPKYNYIEEPCEFNFFEFVNVLSLNKILKNSSATKAAIAAMQGLCPPDHISIVSNCNLRKNLTKEQEFILSQLDRPKKIQDLLKTCNLSEFEITLNIIKLRRKKMLKVVGDRNREIAET